MYRFVAAALVGLVLLALAWYLLESPATDAPPEPRPATPEDERAPPAGLDAGKGEPAAIEGPVEGGFVGQVRRDGRPCAARIEVGLLGRPYSNAAILNDPSPYVLVARSGPDGEFRTSGLPRGKYLIRATAADGAVGGGFSRITSYNRWAFVVIDIPDGDLVLRGRAVHSDGRPFRGRVGAIVVNAIGWPLLRCPPTEPDGEGYFAFFGLVPGFVRLTAREPGRLYVESAARRLPREDDVLFVVDE
ncbi:MAG: carboxypeptidase-like regulatory domain-containing protein, partial [Planctomycetota bacterium]